MPNVMGPDAIERMINTYVRQLEDLAYSKNATMAVRLQGALDTALLISGFSGSAWSGKVDKALSLVMADKPSMEPLKNTVPDIIASAVSLPTPQKATQPPGLSVVPPLPHV